MGTSKEWKWGYISRQGDLVIPPIFDSASCFCDGLAAVKVEWARGYINHSGVFVINPIFEAAGDFNDGLAIVKLAGATHSIDRNGILQDVIATPSSPAPEIEVGINPHFEIHDGLERFIVNQKYGYRDIDGKEIIKPQFFDACDFSEGLACVRKGKTSSWGYIDKTGQFVIPPTFKQAKPFREGLAAVLAAVEEVI